MNKEEKLNDLYNYFWWINDKTENRVEIDKNIMKNIKNNKYKKSMMLNIIFAMEWIFEKVDFKKCKVVLDKGNNRELYISILYNDLTFQSSEYIVCKNNVSFLHLLD